MVASITATADDGILIKNNHITAAGGIARRWPRHAPAAARVKVEVECTHAHEVADALAADAEIMLLDNMSTDEMTVAVRQIDGAPFEASGGVRLDTVAAIAATGVDIISIGALTHSAPVVDLHMTLFLE